MSPAMCRAAGGIMLVSGEPTRVARALPALEPMTGKVLALGPRPDLAACTKLFGNAMIFAIVGGLADVLAMARAEGVPGRDALALFEHFKPAGQIELRGQRMVAEDLAPSFALAMARKDLGLMLELLERTGEAPAVLGALAARFDARVAEGHGAHDLASIGVPSRVSPSAAEPKG
jgi:2-hydroxy-3-oxopropionate reductase